MVPIHDMNTILPGTQCFVKISNDPIEYGNDTHSMCSVADIDRDGNIDVVISGALNAVTGRTAVFYWNVTKNTIAYTLTPSSADLGYAPAHSNYANYLTGWIWGTGRVNIGDANGDGKSDLSFVAGSHLMVLTTNAAGTGLQTLWTQNLTAIAGNPAGSIGFRQINDSRSGVIAVTIYDFNNDGDPSMVYRDQSALVVVDGATGTSVEWTSPCNSHTYTEGPVIADVNGDGATDICVTCAAGVFTATDNDLAQQKLGQFRLYYSSGNEWLPTRKVWNQHPYYVVNINDDLTLPFPQLDQNLVFGTAPCPNGTPGPQMPLNVFMNQIPQLSPNGCPVFPAPDLSYVGDNPDNPGVDSNGDGAYTPTVEVIPPICGNLGIQVRFNIINDGDLPITGNIPVSFWKADPTLPGVTLADRLFASNINIVNLGVDQTLTTAYMNFNGTGGTFRLYIVLNNSGSGTLPINLTLPSPTECRIDNNIYSVNITPDPFITKIEKIQDNFKCINSAPNTGELRVRIFKGAVEETDYSQYGFQWYTGVATSPTIIAGATNYNLTGLAEGDYTARVQNVVKGCFGIFVDTLIVRSGVDPDVTIVATNQTLCNPPNGTLTATVAGGNTGYTFTWFDVGLNPLGITGSVANNMSAGNYKLIVSKDGCTEQIDSPPIGAPPIPDVTPSVLQNVVDCVNPNSGSITATAIFNAVPQDPNNYTFTWYNYNSANTPPRGSVLPIAHGTGPTRTGLPVGSYQIVIQDNATQCFANQAPVVDVTSQTVLPVASISEVAPQTSCDPLQPNGILTASAVAGALVSPNDFTFEWFKGDNTLPGNLVTSVSGTKGETVNQVEGGGVYYTVKITTPNNCSDTEKFIISENKVVPVVTLDSINNSICNPALAASAFNGSVIPAVTFGGTAVTNFTNYQFTWHDGPLSTDPPIGGNTPTLTQLDGGFYTLVVERTDLHCPSIPVNIEVLNRTTLPRIKTDSIPSTNCVVNYNGNLIANGQARVLTVDGAAPTANYTFLWSDNASTTDADGRTTQTITQIQGGFIYTVLVTNTQTGCQNTDNVPLTDMSIVPAATLVVLQNNGICDPTLTVPPVQFNGRLEAGFSTTSGNLADYKYTWRNVTAGTPLGDTPPPQAGLLANQFGGLNGGITYGVIAENTVLGCTSGEATRFLPNQVVLPKIKTDSIASTNCVVNYNGNMIANGQATVLSVDGAAPNANYTYLWSDNASTTDADGRTTQTITQIQGGFIYTVQVTNLLTGCRNTDPVPLADASIVPIATLTVLQNNGICDPTLTVPPVQFNGRLEAGFSTTSGNLADYKYTWRNVTAGTPLGDTPPPQTGLLANQFGGLNGGLTYGVIAENTILGCTSGEATRFLPNTLALPVIKTDSLASTNCVLNYGGNMIANGQAFVESVDNTTPPASNYTFIWSDNASTTDADGRTTQTITQLQGGFIYTVQVTNILTGCRNTDPVPLADASIVPVATLDVLQSNGICDPTLTIPPVQFNGRLEAGFSTTSGNLTDYKYTWRNVTTTVALGETPPPQAGLLVNQFGGLNGGFTYGVIAENTILGCTSGEATRFLPNLLVLPVVETDSTPSSNCVVNYNGNLIANGDATVTTVNGVAPTPNFTFLWSDNASTTDADGRTTQTISQLQGGFIYSVQVTNILTGCRTLDPVDLPDQSVVPIVQLVVEQDNGICNPAATNPPVPFSGRIKANFIVNSGNLTDYEYTWANVTDALPLGTTPPTNTGPGVTTNDQFGGLNGGKTYSVVAENTVLGCTAGIATVPLLNTFVFPKIETDSIPSTNCQVTYNAQPKSNGQISLFEIDDDTQFGNYVIQWSDDGATPTPTSSTGTLLTNLEGAFQYTITVTSNATGCVNNHVVALTADKVTPIIDVTKTADNVNCDEATFGSTGALEAVVTYRTVVQNNPGGAPALPANYLLTWSTTTTGDVLAGVGDGTYTAQVIDEDLGCVSNTDGDVVLDALVPPIITIDPMVDITAQTSCSATKNGAMDATITTTTGTLQYQWYNGIGITGTTIGGLVAAQATGTVTTIAGRDSDDYTLFVRNEVTGCEAIKSSFIPNDIINPSIAFTNVNPVTICRPTPNGSAEPVITDLRNISGTEFSIFYKYTFDGGVAPSSPAVIKAGPFDPKNVLNNTTALNPGINPPVYDDMAPGYLTALVVDNKTSCESAVTTIQIINNTVDNTISIVGTTAAGFCGGNGGEIDVTVAGGVAPQTYSWFAGTPSNNNINFFNNLPDMSGATAVLDDLTNPLTGTVNGVNEDLGDPQPSLGVGAGTYTLIITDANGCGAYFVETVPFATAPTITVNEIPNTKCIGPFTGELQVDVSGGTDDGYSIQIFSGNGPIGTPLAEIGIPTPVLNPLPQPVITSVSLDALALEDGQYYVQVVDYETNNENCPLGSVHVIDQNVFAPQISIDDIVENTACDATTAADGKIELTATADANHNTVMNPTDFIISAITPLPLGFVAPDDIPDDGTSSGLISGFAPGAYTITVTDDNSGCSADAPVNIPDQPVLPTIFAVSSLNDSYCAPTSNGNIEVTDVGVGAPEPIANYAFEWYTDSDISLPANLAYTAQGGGATTGELYDGTKPNWGFGVAGEGNGTRVFFVRGRRTTGNGIGCYTQLEQRTILDVHKTPNLTLATFDNTSCVPAAGEGVIRATTTIEDDPRDPNVDALGTYTYTWTPDPVGGNATGVAGVSIAPAFLDITALTDGLYEVTTVNSVNGCAFTGSTTITTNPLPITLLSYTKQNQLICDPDGNIQIAEVEIDASNSSNPFVFSFIPNSGDPLTDLANNFDFQWFLANNDSDDNNATFDDGSPLAVNDDILDDVNLPTFAAGTYYVIATRKAGMSPGNGCSTVPTRVDIIQDVNTPVITSIEPFANTSCITTIVEGRIELVVNTSSAVGAESGSNYDIVWNATDPVNVAGDGNAMDVANAAATNIAAPFTIPPGYTPPPFPNSPPGPALRDDTYTVTIENRYSGCTVTGQVTITPQRFPVTLISFTKQDQLICDADGRITITQVTIDGSTSNLPVYNYNSNALLTANWDFEWFDANNDADNNPSTFNDAVPIVDGASAPIIDVTLSEDIAETSQPFAGMGEGTYYVVATRKAGFVPGAGCSTTPVQVVIEDNHINPEITDLDAFANTSCDAGVVEGRINLDFNTPSLVGAETGSTYTVSWTPLNNTVGTTIVGGGVLTTNIPPTYTPPPAVLTLADALVDDTYTITVTNDYSNCSVTTQGVVPRQNYPITLISFTKQDQLICDADGRITVTEVTIDGSTSGLGLFAFNTPANLTANFDFEWFDANNDGDNNANTFSDAIPILDGSAAPITDVVLSEDALETSQPFANMGEGTYYVLATRKPGMAPGAGCSTLPIRVNITDEHINPEITDLDAFANTSCDAGVVEGRINLDFNTPSLVGAETGSTYTVSWTPLNNTVGTTIVGGGVLTTNIPPTYAPPPAVLTLADALVDDTYTITVTNDYSNCSVTTQGVVPRQNYPITLISFIKQDQLICDPDGRITVTEVTIDGSTSGLGVFNFNTPGNLTANFDFEWFDANNDGDNNANTFSDAIPLVDGSAAPITDVVLSEDPIETTQPFANMGEGTYYVLATRKPGMAPGAGCSTLPIRVNITDEHINPEITDLDAFANTSCDAAIVEGRIELDVNTPSLVGSESGSSYTVVWTPANATVGNAVIPAASSSLTIPPTYSFPPALNTPADALGEGTYTITVTNDYSNCSVTGQAVIVPQRYPLAIISVDKVDQLICNPDGEISVTEVTIDGTTSGIGVFNFNTPAQLSTNFDFTWFAANNDGDNNDATFNNGVPILDAASNPIIDVVLTEDGLNTTQPYTTMAAGTYYVIAKRKPGLVPGAGCFTEPVRIDIQDLHVNPTVSLSYVPNTSCDLVNPNGLVVADAEEPDGTNIDNYTFTWTLNGGPLFGSTVVTNPDNHSAQLTDAPEGNYVVLVENVSGTGCEVTGNITVIKDLNISLPNIINVNPTHPINCNPSASAIVTSISIGNGLQFFQEPPDDLDVNFDFEWFRDDVTPVNLIAGQTDNNIAGLIPGTYYVNVVDLTTACRSTPKEVVILDDNIVYPVINIQQTQPQISCVAGIGTAILVATADGQTDADPNYSFEWFPNLDVTPPSFATTSTIGGLVAGNYSVTALDAFTGCSASGYYVVPDDAPRFLPVLSLSTDPRVNCINPDGSLLAREVGFNPNSGYPFPANYSTEIYTGANANVTVPGTPIPNVPGFNRNWIMVGLDVGTYTVKIIDNNTGCIVTGEEAVQDGRTPPEVIVDEENPMTNCDPLRPNGQLFATADGGRVGGYAFEWYAGATVAGALIQNENILMAATAGTYTVRVTNDITGCFADESGIVTDGTVAAPIPTPEVISHMTHCIDPNGWVTATVGGIILNYDFFWYDGDSDAGTADFNGVDYTGRADGLYTVKVMDVTTGCFSPPATVEVEDQRVFPVLTFTTTASYCTDVPDLSQGTGSIDTVIDPNDVSTDSIIWVDLSTNAVVANSSYVYGLFPGFYEATLVTTQGCVATGTAEIPTEIRAYNLVTRNGDQQNDRFVVDCLSLFPNNNVKIFNRSGVLVYEIDGYNNVDKVFQGLGENGIYASGKDLPVGTYFYIIDKRDGSKPRTGYLELVK
jgi:hypothetical protein